MTIVAGIDLGTASVRVSLLDHERVKAPIIILAVALQRERKL